MTIEGMQYIRDDNDVVLMKVLKEFGGKQIGEVVQTVWKFAKTWIKSGCAILIENDEETMSVLRDPNLFRRITVDEFGKMIVGEVENRQTIFLNACGMYVQNNQVASYNLCVDSESGAGKDYVVNTIIEFFPKVESPKEMGWVRRRRISPTVFNYWHTTENDPDWTWDGKICYLPDIPNIVANHEVFKVMCSEGSEATITVNNKAVDIEVSGKPVMFITTASNRPSKEMLRRFPRISLDESREQTREIMKRKARLASEGRKAVYDEKIQDALKCLRRIKVKIPFAMDIEKHLPDDHIIMRTHFERFLDYIKASTALHQYQRQKEGSYILAKAPEDYEIARIALIQSTSNKFMIPLSQKEQKVLDVVKKAFSNEWFSVPELSPKVKFLSERKLYDYMDKLQEWFFDVDKQDKENSKKPVKVYSLKDSDRIFIPTWDDIQKAKDGVNYPSFDSIKAVDRTNDTTESNEPQNHPDVEEPYPNGIPPHPNLLRAKRGNTND